MAENENYDLMLFLGRFCPDELNLVAAERHHDSDGSAVYELECWIGFPPKGRPVKRTVTISGVDLKFLTKESRYSCLRSVFTLAFLSMLRPKVGDE